MSRPRLFGRLAARARVIVVSAPAGSGKTVLLRSWISQPGVAGRAGVGAGAAADGGAGSGRGAIAERLLADLAPLDEALWR